MKSGFHPPRFSFYALFFTPTFIHSFLLFQAETIAWVHHHAPQLRIGMKILTKSRYVVVDEESCRGERDETAAVAARTCHMTAVRKQGISNTRYYFS